MSEDTLETSHSGGCLCGRVRWKVRGELRPIVACHCTQCRRTTGHFGAFTGAAHDDFAIEATDSLSWYRSSETATRGFCASCGSFLFWQSDGASRISIAAGSIDGQSGLTITKHIFCADKGDYYEITGDAVQLAGY